MQLKYNFIPLLIVFSIYSYSQQKINTDSLLIKTKEYLKNEDYFKAKKMCYKAINIAPSYLDFHLILGFAHLKTQQIDSSRYYFNHIIIKNPNYTDAYTGLIQLECQEKNYEKALEIVNQSLNIHENDIDLEVKKLELLEITKKDLEKEIYTKQLKSKYPNNSIIQQKIIDEKSAQQSIRAGINYNFTFIDRENIGPWQLTSLQFIHELKKISSIFQIHYTDRKTNSISVAHGTQFELENYFKHNKKNYSYTAISYSNSNAFPKWRFGYSYYQTLFKTWEVDLGFRYTAIPNNSVLTIVTGVTKYLGSYWINLRNYLSIIDGKAYPSVNANIRYYFSTKYDYVSALIGYGTSPDERTNIGIFQDRFTFNSYRLQLGYNKLLGKHFLTGVQAGINNQEFFPSKYQNEYNVSVFLHYKF